MVNSTGFEYIMFVLIMLNTLCLAMQVGKAETLLKLLAEVEGKDMGNIMPLNYGNLYFFMK